MKAGRREEDLRARTQEKTGETRGGYMSAEQTSLTRRDFVKWSAAAATVAAASGLVGVEALADQPEGAVVDVPEMTGEWKNAPCWFDCGGNCVNQVYIEDGVVKYQRTDVAGDDTYDAPQQRGCFRGRSMRKLVFGADRLKYPMKRKNWQPGGGENAHGELRGCDEWERISWEEAHRAGRRRDQAHRRHLRQPVDPLVRAQWPRPLLQRHRRLHHLAGPPGLRAVATGPARRWSAAAGRATP